MSEEQKTAQQEELLNKAIDELIDEVFVEEEVEKSIDIAKDAEETADEAVGKAPKGQKDEARGAGRPKQISDVPQTDMDGRRESKYDDSTTEREGKEDEPEETEQSPSMDQTQEKKRMGGKPKAPEMRPFKKSEEEASIRQLSEEEYAEYLEFKKSKAEEAAKAEELKKAEEMKKAEEKQESLVKAAVEEATSELRKSLDEANALIKAIAKQPVRAKSVTGIEALEKSQEEEKGPETFSKSEMLDAAEELVKSGLIKSDVVTELEMTGYVYDGASRTLIEKQLQKK